VNTIEAGDLHTETFSNARGWIAVRVTHRPSALVVERERTNALRSAVQAQKECVEEIRELLHSGASPAPEAASGPRRAPLGLVPRAEFDRLAARVAALEERVSELEAAREG
jgi:hypothetical protein